jgi:membrane protein DedA with SNARE-associated domain
MVPGVRTLVSVPAGVAGMPLAPFLAYSAVGTVAWTGLLAGAGYLLEGQYGKVSGWLDPVSNAAFGAILLWYLYRVATFRQGRASS